MALVDHNIMRDTFSDETKEYSKLRLEYNKNVELSKELTTSRERNVRILNESTEQLGRVLEHFQE